MLGLSISSAVLSANLTCELSVMPADDHTGSQGETDLLVVLLARLL